MCMSNCWREHDVQEALHAKSPLHQEHGTESLRSCVGMLGVGWQVRSLPFSTLILHGEEDRKMLQRLTCASQLCAPLAVACQDDIIPLAQSEAFVSEMQRSCAQAHL